MDAPKHTNINTTSPEYATALNRVHEILELMSSVGFISALAALNPEDWKAMKTVDCKLYALVTNAYMFSRKAEEHIQTEYKKEYIHV